MLFLIIILLENAIKDIPLNKSDDINQNINVEEQ